MTELYEFIHGAQAYRFTSADEPIEHGGAIWQTAPIRRGNLMQSQELGRAQLRLTVPRSFPVADLFRVAPPAAPISLTVRSLAGVLWIGRVISAEWSELTATLVCETAWSAVKRDGGGRRFGYQCPYVVYGPECAAVAADMRVSATVLSVSGASVEAAAFSAHPDGWFDGGYLEWVDSAGTPHRRYIVAHAGATVSLAQQAPSLAAGMSATALPGCDHTLDTCDGKFDNAENFGGFPWIPTKNPIGGSSIY